MADHWCHHPIQKYKPYIYISHNLPLQVHVIAGLPRPGHPAASSERRPARLADPLRGDGGRRVPPRLPARPVALRPTLATLPRSADRRRGLHHVRRSCARRSAHRLAR